MKTIICAAMAAVIVLAGWGQSSMPTTGRNQFFVAPYGEDAAAGSYEKPFATVGRAQDAVRAMKKAGALPKGGVTVWLRGGTYRMERPLSLDTKDSGEEGAPVSYRAWKDETPVLFGGWTVPASAWRKADDPRIPDAAKGKVWCADVRLLGYDALDPDAPCGFHTARPLYRIRSLYRNGKNLPLARYPNGGFIKTGKLAQERKGAFTANVGEWTRWSPENRGISCTATASTTARGRSSAACRYTADAGTWCATTCSRVVRSA